MCCEVVWRKSGSYAWLCRCSYSVWGQRIVSLHSIKALKLDLNSVDRCNSIKISSHESQKETLIAKFPQLFDERRTGECINFTDELHLKDGAIPQFCNPQELDRLVDQKISKSIDTSGRAIPIVVVPKANRAFRIDADFRMGLNSQLEVDQYHIPTMQELSGKLQDTYIFKNRSF
ncbi:hypothetical protein RF11_12053 [Thelohanellus kitauei]|uniref:Uncharacterized protein n=1 Tax=Thelohanellus kitauei TaxID=669202 RepID=A0A0C2JHJ5_THEKT|nr:hypothetical protein RF11_12053 [Thelohanellus kitauei]